MKGKGKISYQIVDCEVAPKYTLIKAIYNNHFIKLFYRTKDFKGKLLWFGEIYIDGKLYWQSPESFGCDTKDILDDEIQHRLYTWALKEGYISHHKLAP